MTKKWALIITLVAIVAGVLTMACEPPPPPPSADCSPGFWKNHTEDWKVYKPDWKYQGGPMTLLDALQGGRHTRASRFIVAGWLNAAYPDAPCD
jgi:hypothetical protein